MNNYERIKNLSPAAMAVWLGKNLDCNRCPMNCTEGEVTPKKCAAKMLAYLLSEKGEAK